MDKEEINALLKCVKTLIKGLLKYPCLECAPKPDCYAAEPVCVFIRKLTETLENTLIMILDGKNGPLPGQSAKEYSIRMVSLSITGAFNSFVEEYLADKPGGLATASVAALLAIMNKQGLDWKKVTKDMKFFELEAFDDEEDKGGPGPGVRRRCF